jgi:hypothetical protein
MGLKGFIQVKEITGDTATIQDYLPTKVVYNTIDVRTYFQDTTIYSKEYWVIDSLSHPGYFSFRGPDDCGDYIFFDTEAWSKRKSCGPWQNLKGVDTNWLKRRLLHEYDYWDNVHGHVITTYYHLTVKGIGIVKSYGYAPIIEYSPISLAAAVIDGVKYGDTTLTSISKQFQDDKYVPSAFQLLQNYPNPFNPTTRIEFSLPKASRVILKIHDLLGKEIGTLINEKLPAGVHSTIWNATNYPTGIYFYRLQTENFSKTKKLLLIK